MLRLTELCMLLALFGEDDKLPDKISNLEQEFATTSSTAVKWGLDYLCREQVHVRVLFNRLSKVFYQHGLQESMDHRDRPSEDEGIPRIICSMALVG